jgi:hypothetical protein
VTAQGGVGGGGGKNNVGVGEEEQIGGHMEQGQTGAITVVSNPKKPCFSSFPEKALPHLHLRECHCYEIRTYVSLKRPSHQIRLA